MSQSSVSINSISPDSNLIGDRLTTINVLTLQGTGLSGSQISIFDGSTLLGTVLVDISGFWNFTTPTLWDRTHGLFATGASDGISQLVEITVAPSVTSFSSENGAQIKIDGKKYFVQNSNSSWSLSSPDPHTLRFQVKGGDRWDNDPSGHERSEIGGKKTFSPGKEINVSYSFMVEPGPANTVSEPGKWLILSQFHADDKGDDVAIPSPFAIEMIGENLAVLIQYCLPGEKPSDAVFIYKDSDDIERGKYYDIEIKAEFSADKSGYVGVWLNGEQIVDYHGPLGDDNGVYWKQGVYRTTASESIAVNYKNLYIETRDPATPIAAGGGETIVGTSNRDVVDADSAPKGRPLPSAEGDLIMGKGGKDRLFGLAGDDEIFGDSGRDKLFGGDGNDILSGGRGADRLSGGAGADRFIFGSIAESRNGGDRILDFNQGEGDAIHLSGIDADRKLAGDQPFIFIGDTAFSSVAGELRFSNHRLAGDTNGDGDADFVVKVAGSLTIAAGDLLL